MEKKGTKLRSRKLKKSMNMRHIWGEVGDSDIVYFPSQIDSKNNDDEIILGVLQPP